MGDRKTPRWVLWFAALAGTPAAVAAGAFFTGVDLLAKYSGGLAVFLGLFLTPQPPRRPILGLLVVTHVFLVLIFLRGGVSGLSTFLGLGNVQVLLHENTIVAVTA